MPVLLKQLPPPPARELATKVRRQAAAEAAAHLSSQQVGTFGRARGPAQGLREAPPVAMEQRRQQQQHRGAGAGAGAVQEQIGAPAWAEVEQGRRKMHPMLGSELKVLQKPRKVLQELSRAAAAEVVVDGTEKAEAEVEPT